jgi:hypothetical protein
MGALRTLVLIEPGRAGDAAVEEARAQAGARGRLATAGLDVTCRFLVDGRDPPLEEFAAAGAFGLILLPSRRPRWRSARHPSARRLTCLTRAEVRLVARP